MDIIVPPTGLPSLPLDAQEIIIKRNRDNSLTHTIVSKTEDKIAFKKVTEHPNGNRDFTGFETSKQTIADNRSQYERIQQIRDQNVNQTDTAKALGVSQSTVSRRENGK